LLDKFYEALLLSLSLCGTIFAVNIGSVADDRFNEIMAEAEFKEMGDVYRMLEIAVHKKREERKLKAMLCYAFQSGTGGVGTVAELGFETCCQVEKV